MLAISHAGLPLLSTYLAPYKIRVIPNRLCFEIPLRSFFVTIYPQKEKEREKRGEELVRSTLANLLQTFWNVGGFEGLGFRVGGAARSRAFR